MMHEDMWASPARVAKSDSVSSQKGQHEWRHQTDRHAII